MLIAMTIPLTGTQYEIEAGDYRATVTELGAGLRGLRFGDTFLITSFDADELPPHGAGQLLTPWPNRVDGGRYAFDGEDHQLALSEPARGNAIHGLTRWVSWTRAAHDEGEVTLRCLPHGQQGYPYAVQTDVTYRVDAETGPVMTTVDPADIRGLGTTVLCSVERLPRSRHEGRLASPLNAVEVCADTGAHAPALPRRPC